MVSSEAQAVRKGAISVLSGCVVLAGGVAALAIGAGIYFNLAETSSTRCANYDELVDSGLMGRGWLPDSIPKSVTNVDETHDIDSNKVNATFYIDVGEVNTLVAGFRELDGDELPRALQRARESDPDRIPRTRIFVRSRQLCSVCGEHREKMYVDMKNGRVRYSAGF